MSILLAALISISGLGRATCLKLLEEFEAKKTSPIESWGRREWLRIAKKGVSTATLENIKKFQQTWTLQRYAEYLDDKKIRLVSYQDEVYPPLLRQITDFPLVLFTRGNLDCLRPQHIAVVGSRRPTQYGKWATQHIVSGLVGQDISIVSGFMVGIDYQAHVTAQMIGGRSVGVLGFGFDHFYPQHMESAAKKFLAENQLLITEYPPAIEPVGGQFAARNRIVAGMSSATVVVEAQQKSGSLITAQCAVDSGRVVGAVPGPIDSRLSDGAHDLIRQGAVLTRNAEDILSEISFTSTKITVLLEEK